MPTPSDDATRFSPAELGATAQPLTTCPPEPNSQTHIGEQSSQIRDDLIDSSPRLEAVASLEKGLEDVDRETSVGSETIIDERCVNEEEASRNAAPSSNVSQHRSSSSPTAQPPSTGGTITASTASSTLEFSSIRVRLHFGVADTRRTALLGSILANNLT